MHLMDFVPVIVFAGDEVTPQVEEENAYAAENGYEPKRFRTPGLHPGEDAREIKARLDRADRQSIRHVRRGLDVDQSQSLAARVRHEER